jgi:hypothetical protein
MNHPAASGRGIHPKRLKGYISTGAASRESLPLSLRGGQVGLLRVTPPDPLLRQEGEPESTSAVFKNESCNFDTVFKEEKELLRVI